MIQEGKKRENREKNNIKKAQGTIANSVLRKIQRKSDDKKQCLNDSNTDSREFSEKLSINQKFYSEKL